MIIKLQKGSVRRYHQAKEIRCERQWFDSDDLNSIEEWEKQIGTHSGFLIDADNAVKEANHVKAYHICYVPFESEGWHDCENFVAYNCEIYIMNDQGVTIDIPSKW